MTFDNNKIQSAPANKHLGLILNSKLDFNQHIYKKIKCNTIIRTMRSLSMILPRKHLQAIYKYFVRPILDYAEIIYDKPFKEMFKGKVEAVQHKIV